jgi:two-component system response regulator CpxR
MVLTTEKTGPVHSRGVLVVDDDDDIRTAVQEVLEGEGYPTAGACNGREALEMLRSTEPLPALILLDLMMPEMDGWELLVRMDEIPNLHRIPVALMSAHPSIRRAFDKTTKESAKRVGTSLLLPKPLNLLRLLSIVHRIIPEETTA